MKTVKKVFGAFFIVLSANAFAGPQDEFNDVLTKLNAGAQTRVVINLQMCKDDNGQTPSAIFDNGVTGLNSYFTPGHALVSKSDKVDVRMITLTWSQKMQGNDPFNEAKKLTILDTTTSLMLIEDGLAMLSYTISTQEHPSAQYYQFRCDWANGIEIYYQTPVSLPVSMLGKEGGFSFLPMDQQLQAMSKRNHQVQPAGKPTRTRLQPLAFLGCCLSSPTK